MATMISDTWYLHPLTIDTAYQSLPETLVASPEDYQGKGIALSITDNGAPLDTSGCTVLLAWHNLNSGKSNSRSFAAVNAAQGRWKCTYPTEMLTSGVVRARVVIKTASGNPITSSREFNIRVEHAITNELSGQAKDDLSAFQEGVRDLNKTNRDVQDAESKRADAENRRAEAEASRTESEDNRAAAEEARVSEFATLKRESQAATGAANTAAGKANAAADNANASAATASNVVAEAVKALSQQESGSDTALIEALAKMLRNDYGCFYLANTIWTKSTETTYASNTMTLSCSAYANGNITLG